MIDLKDPRPNPLPEAVRQVTGLMVDVFVSDNWEANTKSIQVYADLRRNGFCLLHENGDIDAPIKLRFDTELNILGHTEDEVAAFFRNTLTNGFLVDLSDLIITIPEMEGLRDPLLSMVGRGRLLPRDFAETHIRRLVEAEVKSNGKSNTAKRVVHDSPFRYENWFPEERKR